MIITFSHFQNNQFCSKIALKNLFILRTELSYKLKKQAYENDNESVKIT